MEEGFCIKKTMRFVKKWSKKDKSFIRSRANVILAAVLILGASVFLTGCDDAEYADNDYYADDNYYVDNDYYADNDYADDNYNINDNYGEANGWQDNAENGWEDITQNDGEYIGYDNSEEIAGSGITLYGSSGKLEGTIAVVTILVDDATGTWNLSEDADFKVYSAIYNNLKISCGWIENACAEYGRNVKLIWDWVAHEELIYSTSLNMSVGDNYNSAYVDMQDFINTYIDSDGIKSTLGANGIIYVACVNSPSSNTIASNTFSWKNNSPLEYEVCFMLMNYKGQVKAPAPFAHEMLHTFGAPDLYYAGKRGITQEYVDYAKSAKTNDIMRVTWDLNTGGYVYDSIKNEITEITAYYLGLTDYSKTVQEWGLGQSDYDD